MTIRHPSRAHSIPVRRSRTRQRERESSRRRAAERWRRWLRVAASILAYVATADATSQPATDEPTHLRQMR